MDRPLKHVLGDRPRAEVRPTSIQLLDTSKVLRSDLSAHVFQSAELERMRKELDAAQRQYRALEASLPVGLLRLSPSGFIEHASERAREMLGVGRLANHRMLRYVDLKYAGVFSAALASAFDGRPPQHLDLMLVGPNGQRLHCQAVLHEVVDAEEPRVLVSLLDVSRVSQANRLAKQAGADLEAVVKHAVLPMVVLGADGRMVAANERAAELLASPERALMGQALDHWIVEHGRESFNDLIVRRGRGPLTLDMVASGQARRVRVHLVGVQWEEEPGLVVTLEDVTERERQASRDEREGRLASLGLLVAGVGHEVNNPLAFVVPNVGEVAEAVRVIEPGRAVGHLTAGEAVEMLDEASAGLDRIASIVRDLKGFHSTDDTLEVLSVNEVVVDTLRLADARLRQNARVRRDLGSVPVLQANRGRLGQVMLNLLFNAAEAMPDRERDDNRITIRTWFDEGVVHLLVRDNGKGIDPQHLPNLFDPFFTTRKVGSGLGLAICANIVRDMGGWIEVNSAVGTGTDFLLCFPLAGDEHVPQRVLLVSEEPMLIRGGDVSRRYAIVQACGGFEAIRILQHEEKVDAVVAARKLREGSGEDVYDWVCRHRPTLKPRFRFLEDGGGASDGTVLPKPITGRALLRLLDSVVGQS